jgi:hypothetical protein
MSDNEKALALILCSGAMIVMCNRRRSGDVGGKPNSTENASVMNLYDI